MVYLDWNLDESCCEDLKSFLVIVCCICHFWFMFQCRRLFICLCSSHNKFFCMNFQSLVILFCFYF